MREVQNAFCKRNYWMWTYWIILYCTYQQESVETRVKKWSFFSSNRQSRGWRLRPFPGMLLCPLNIPKITIFHGIGCSLHLNIEHLFVLLCFLGVWAKAWVWASNRSAKLAAVRLCAIRCYKIPELLGLEWRWRIRDRKDRFSKIEVRWLYFIEKVTNALARCLGGCLHGGLCVGWSCTG